jgi:histone H3/H4
MARNKVRIPCFDTFSPLIDRPKQTFRKSTGGKCSSYSASVIIYSLSLPGKAPVVHLPCMTPLRQPPQPKTRRRPTGTVAVREIRKYQKNVYLLVPKTSFQRLAKEIATDYQARLYACNTATDLTLSASSRTCDFSHQHFWRFKRLPKTCVLFSIHRIQSKQQVVQYLVSMFQDAMRVAQHAHRETMFVPYRRVTYLLTIVLPSQPRDIVLVLRVRGDSI